MTIKDSDSGSWTIRVTYFRGSFFFNGIFMEQAIDETKVEKNRFVLNRAKKIFGFRKYTRMLGSCRYYRIPRVTSQVRYEMTDDDSRDKFFIHSARDITLSSVLRKHKYSRASRLLLWICTCSRCYLLIDRFESHGAAAIWISDSRSGAIWQP